jgi:hypothetical protein
MKYQGISRITRCVTLTVALVAGRGGEDEEQAEEAGGADSEPK